MNPVTLQETLHNFSIMYDRAEKVPIYARESVAHAWLLDPDEQSLEVFRLERGSLRLIATHRGEAKVSAEPFDSIELDLALLWRW